MKKKPYGYSKKEIKAMKKKCTGPRHYWPDLGRGNMIASEIIDSGDCRDEVTEANCKCIMCGEPHHCQDDCHVHRPSIGTCFCGRCFYEQLYKLDENDTVRRANHKILQDGTRQEIEALLALLWIAK